MKLKINVDELGSGKVFLNDMDLSNHVFGISLDASVGTLTSVQITLKNIEVEGIVKAEDVEIKDG